MNKLSITDEQLKIFRGMQGILLKLGQDDEPGDIIMCQVKNIERMVNDWMDVFVMKQLVLMKIATVPGAKFHMIPQQVSAFRGLQAESFLVAKENNFELWKLHQGKIEQWVSDQLDHAVIAVSQGLIKVRGN